MSEEAALALTRHQRALLSAVAKGSAAARPGGRSVTALRRAGLVEWDGEAGDGTWWLVITDEGRAALSASPTPSPA